MMRMGADGCKWVRIGALGHRDTGRPENKGGRGINGRSGQYLAMHDHGEKMQEVVLMVMVD